MKIFICIKDDIAPKFSMDHDSHESLIKDAGIKDDRIFERNFVRVQISPRGDWFDPMVRFNGWLISVDEEKTLPMWFESEKVLWFDRCLREIEGKILPLLADGIFPGNFTVNKDIKTNKLRKITGGLNVNGSAALNAPNLEFVGGTISVSQHASLISGLK